MQLKIKYPSDQGIIVVRGDQNVAQKCLVAAITHEGKQKEQIKSAPL